MYTCGWDGRIFMWDEFHIILIESYLLIYKVKVHLTTYQVTLPVSSVRYFVFAFGGWTVFLTEIRQSLVTRFWVKLAKFLQRLHFSVVLKLLRCHGNSQIFTRTQATLPKLLLLYFDFAMFGFRNCCYLCDIVLLWMITAQKRSKLSSVSSQVGSLILGVVESRLVSGVNIFSSPTKYNRAKLNGRSRSG